MCNRQFDSLFKKEIQKKKEHNTVVDKEHIAASANRKNRNLKNGSKKRMIMTI